MLNIIKNIFIKSKKTKGFEGYKSLSDFMLHASPDEQERVIVEASHKANKDQMETIKESRLRLKTR